MPETPVNIGKIARCGVRMVRPKDELQLLGRQQSGPRRTCCRAMPEMPGHGFPQCDLRRKDAQEIFSKIEQPKPAANQHGSGNRPTLRILSGKRAPEPRSSAAEASDWKPFQGE